MNTVPYKNLNQLPETDFIVIPLVKNERKKILKCIESCESQYPADWSKGAIQMILQQDLAPGKSVIQWVGKSRLVLIGVDESGSYQVLSAMARSALFKQFDKQDIANTIFIVPVFLKRKTISALSNGLSMAYMRVNYFKHDRKKEYGNLSFYPEHHKAQTLAAIREGLTLADVQKDICGLVNLPPNEKNPLYLVNWAKERFADKNYTIKILDQNNLQEEGLDALINVGKGSRTPPYLLVIHYNDKGTTARPLSLGKAVLTKGRINRTGKGSTYKHIGLIGKGVTFDTGGISLKDPANMYLMKSDMGGAAAVLGAMDLMGRMKLQVRVTAVIPLAENAIGPDAYRPGDIISSYSGKSIEVIDTDAEGRLILADAIAYMIKNYKPDILVDFATLTGSIITTLGYKAAGVFTNNEELSHSLQQAAEVSGERLWRLPLWEEYQDEMHSDIADIKNLATKPMAGAITAAKFLQYFTEEHPAWAHIDIAGVAMVDSDYGKQRSATAFGVLLLMQWIKDLIG